MEDLYKLLNVHPDATTSQIKSAYRKLARKKHPDLNKGDEGLAREFGKITDAYKILSEPAQRAGYDRRRLKAKYANDDSVFSSSNPHAKKIRQMAYERQYNEIVDRMILDERRESMALQRVIFPIVSLFVSTVFVTIFRPLFWTNSNAIGKFILLFLFVAGSIHFIKRIYDGFERFTYTPIDVHETIIYELEEEETRPYSRAQAIVFLLVGFTLSITIGLVIGNFLEYMNKAMMPGVYSSTIHPEFIFYPPIVVLLVDGMHAFFARFEH